MSDVDTGTGLFPTDVQLSGGGYCLKTAGTNRKWTLISDGRLVYLFLDYSNNNSYFGGFVFGDIDSYVGSDAFCCSLICSSSGAQQSLFYLNNSANSYLARSYTQLGASVLSFRSSHGRTPNYLGGGGQVFPSPSDNRVHLWPVECWEPSVARGLMPGLWNPVHNSDIPHGFLIENIPQLPNRTLVNQHITSPSYMGVFDITGPWR